MTLCRQRGLEYYTVGHDDALPIYDLSLALRKTMDKSDNNLSFFFAGIGDARHLYTTMIEIMDKETAFGGGRDVHYHFTLNDIKAPVFARSLIIFLLLNELAQMTDYSSEAAGKTLATIFFTFIGTIMPPYVFSHLQGVISRAIRFLQDESRALSWLQIRETDRHAMIKTLLSWQDDVVRSYSTALFISLVQINTMPLRTRPPQVPSRFSEASYSYRNEAGLYYRTALLLLPQSRLKEQEYQLWKLVYGKQAWSPPQRAKKVEKYLKDSWCINVTLVDMEWFSQSGLDDKLAFDPFTLTGDLYGAMSQEEPRNPTMLYDYITPFFVNVAEAFTKLEGRISLEFILGEYTDVLERLRLGLLDQRNRAPVPDQKERGVLPTTFDRIHLSNIPDYLGGHLSSFLHALPATKDTGLSYMRANCLLNPCLWPKLEDYLADYLLITDSSMLNKLMQAHVMPNWEEVSVRPWPVAEYRQFERSRSKAHDFSTLLPRGDLAKWFYALFFRIALPMNVVLPACCRVIPSLNLTILFRIIPHLCSIGYPDHWLAEIITNLLSDKVVTTGRPPRENPLRVESVKRQHPQRKLSTAPFVPELRTLTSIFHNTLPFALPEAVPLPCLSDVALYTISISYKPRTTNKPALSSLALIFLDNADVFDSIKFKSLRPLLDSSWDEVEDRFSGPACGKSKRRQLEALKLVVWTTFRWDSMRNMVKAWIDVDFMETVKAKNWACGMWKIDTWEPVVDRVQSMREMVQEVKRWTD